MKLLHPIRPRGGSGPLRVLVVFRQTACSPVAPATAAARARAYLELVAEDGQTRTSFADASRPRGFGSLAAAREAVASGEVDVVITTDLSRISASALEMAGFVSHCVGHNTRLISFEDSFDSADDDWQQVLATRLADFEPVSTQGGV